MRRFLGGVHAGRDHRPAARHREDVRGYSLQGDVAGGYLPLYEPLRVNAGNVSTIAPFATLPFREWTKRVGLDGPYIRQVLDFVDKLNFALFEKHGKLFYDFR